MSFYDVASNILPGPTAWPVSTSLLYIGGLGCGTSGGTATAGGAAAAACADTPDALRYFEGFIDEVRLFKAGGLLRTSTRPTLTRRTESARLYEYSP